MKTSLFLCGVGGLLAACSGVSDDPGGSDDALTLTPGGEIAIITFKVPFGSIPVDVRVRREGSLSPPVLVEPGWEQPFPAGRYCISTKVKWGEAETKEACDVELRGVQSIVLGAVRFVRSRDEAILGLDLPLKVEQPECSSRVWSTAEGRLLAYVSVVPHAIGSFTYDYLAAADRSMDCTSSGVAGYSFDVARGRVTTVDLNSTAGHEAARIVTAKDESGAPAYWFPNPEFRGVELRVQSSTLDDRFVMRTHEFTGMGDRPVLFRHRRHGILDLALHSKLLAHIETAPGAVLPELRLESIDVLAPIVTLPDGTRKEVERGTGFLRVKGAPLDEGLRFNMPAGFHLPPGAYEVDTFYNDPTTGIEIAETQAVTLP